MKGFVLDETNDVLIKNNQLSLIDGEALLRQSIAKVLSTNKGEWFSNEEEGIRFQNILGKQIDEEIVKSELLDGLIQIDPTFVLTDFRMDVDPVTREMTVSFKAETADGQSVSVRTDY